MSRISWSRNAPLYAVLLLICVIALAIGFDLKRQRYMEEAAAMQTQERSEDILLATSQGNNLAIQQLCGCDGENLNAKGLLVREVFNNLRQLYFVINFVRIFTGEPEICNPTAACCPQEEEDTR